MSGDRVLIVEGSPQLGQALGAAFAADSWDVYGAADGEEGLAQAWDLRPDLIVAGHELAGRTGLELLRALHHSGIDTAFILLARRGSEALAVEALRAGAGDYLSQPFEAHDVVAAAHRLLSVRRARLRTDTEQKLNRLTTILNETEDAIIVVDERNRLLFCNPAASRMFGIDVETALGCQLEQVISHQAMVELFEKEARSGRSRRSEIVLDEGHRTMNAQMTILPGAGRIVVMQDITHLKELDRIKSDFVTSVSHDLRSPLTAILGYVELLSRSGPLNEVQRQFADRITFSVKSITNLISELLELGRIEAGFDQDREPADLRTIVKQAVESRRLELQTKGHRLRIAVPDRIPPVLGNPLRLGQLVSNLLENAIKYTPDAGQISLSLNTDGDFLVLRVSDNGIGIPQDDQPYIFDKFYRSDEAIDHYAGTGLGLSIVKSIVDQHDGRVWVESHVGEGTTFTVMLPTYRDNGASG